MRFGSSCIDADLVQGVILVAEGQTGLTVSVSSGSTVLGTKDLVAGFNKFAFTEMTTGTVTVQVLKGDAVVVKGSGPIAVSRPVCGSGRY